MRESDDEIRAQKLATAFQNNWPAEIDDYLRLAAGPARRQAVVMLCNIDLELRWGESREGRAEDYFQRYPAEWDASPIEALELIAAEYGLRREHARLKNFCEIYGGRHAGLIKLLKDRFPEAPSGSRYRIVNSVGKIGKGGHGEVFPAHDEQLGRKVALKRIRNGYHRDPRNREQFLFEAKITGRLEHPGILPVYSLEFEDDDNVSYAMPLIERGGGNLQDVIAHFHGLDTKVAEADTPPTLDLRQLLGRFIFVCKTISYAHSRGYLHRDIKPANILIGRFGETWVIDWGIAQFIVPVGSRTPSEGSTPGASTASGQPAREHVSISTGTLGYRSPEQAARRPNLGPASDVYGLGATLYSVLTGQERARAVHEGIIPDEFDDKRPPVYPRTIPRALIAICSKPMALNPESRYPSADALGDDVQAFLDGERVIAWREPVTARAALDTEASDRHGLDVRGDGSCRRPGGVARLHRLSRQSV